jgi:hypothetical protein
MLSHDHVFTFAKMKQADLEADATARRLVRAPEEPAAQAEGGVGGGLLATGRRRWRLFGRVRPA